MSWLERFRRPKPVLNDTQRARLAAWRALPEADLDAPAGTVRQVVLDVESSGLNLRRDHLISVGAIALHGSRIALADSLDIVLRQDTASSKDNILIHGLGGETQRNGIAPADALLEVLEFIGRSPLIAFHAAFDRGMLTRAMQEHLHLDFDAPWLDLAHLAPYAYPRLAERHHHLDAWLAHFGIPNFARHNALADALATAELMLAVQARLDTAGPLSFRQLKHLADTHEQATTSRF